MSYTNFRCVDRKFKGEEIIVRMCVHSPKNTKKNFFLVLGLRGAGGGMNHEIGRGKEKEKEKKRRNKEEFEYYMTCM